MPTAATVGAWLTLTLTLALTSTATPPPPPPSHAPRCGFVIGAFGNPEGRSMVAAIWTVKRLVSMAPAAGWCPLAPSLSRYPVTFYTDAELSHLAGRGLATGTKGLSIVHPRGVFEPIAVVGSKVGSHIGAPVYRWYHCQVRHRMT